MLSGAGCENTDLGARCEGTDGISNLGARFVIWGLGVTVHPVIWGL